MNDEELNRLYELLDASYTANCMLIGNELAGSNERIALFSSFATGGFFLARNIHHLETLDQLIEGNIGINLLSQVSELLSCYSIIIFALEICFQFTGIPSHGSAVPHLPGPTSK